MRFRHVTRSGRSVRVADPDWRQPLDPSFATLRGGRWNPPSSFPVLYLCATVAVAREVVLGRFAGLPYGLLDLRSDRRPVLIETDVPTHRAVDVVTDAGCRAASLPVTYPYDARGRKIGWARTQPIGEAAWEPGRTVDRLPQRRPAEGRRRRGAGVVRSRTKRPPRRLRPPFVRGLVLAGSPKGLDQVPLAHPGPTGLCPPSSPARTAALACDPRVHGRELRRVAWQLRPDAPDPGGRPSGASRSCACSAPPSGRS